MSDGIEAARIGARSAVLPLDIVRGRAERAVTEEQLAYASVLDRGMKLGLLLLLATFVAYVSGLASPHVPVADLPRYWSLPVKEYLAATGSPAGWAWVSMIGKGDILNFVPIAFLAGTAIVCYATVCPMFFRKRDVVYGVLTAIEVAVLALAASGLLHAGGH